MSLDFFDAKLSFIKKRLSRRDQKEMSRSLRQYVDTAFSDDLPYHFRRYLAFDLQYIFVRHAPWFHNGLFRLVIREYLSREYGLSKTLVEAKIDRLWERFDGSFYKAIHTKSDESFLLYVIVLTLSLENEEAIHSEFGFGVELLTLLKRSADSWWDDRSALFEFAPDLQIEAFKLIEKVSEKYKHAPWILQVYRLLFDIAHEFPEAAIDELEALSSHVFEALLDLGMRSEHRASEWIQRLKQKDVFMEGTRKDLLKVLENHGLVYSYKENEMSSEPLYALTKDAYELTSQAIGRQDVVKGIGDRFFQLHLSWQREFVKSCEWSQLKGLFESVHRKAILDEKVIVALEERMQKDAGSCVDAGC